MTFRTTGGPDVSGLIAIPGSISGKTSILIFSMKSPSFNNIKYCILNHVIKDFQEIDLS